MNCILCNGETTSFELIYHRCEQCFLVMKDHSLYLSKDEELHRYDMHRNDSMDLNYRNFILKAILPIAEFSFNSHLDFGSGKSSVLVDYYKNKGSYSVPYDLYYFNDQKVFNEKFDLITMTEVIEHLKGPMFELERLVSILNTGGFLVVMTSFYCEDIDFKNWWYKNDFTHIAFYSHQTFEYIAKKFNLKIFYFDHKSVVILQK